MTPDEFWSHTFPELHRKVRGYKRANGIKDEPRTTWKQVERMMKRYPDGPLSPETKRKLKAAHKR